MRRSNEIHGGNAHDDVIIEGNEGDDVIYPGTNIKDTEVISGGKGDDVINPIDIQFNLDGTVNVNSFGAGFMPSSGTQIWYGNEGNDIIWGRKSPNG